MGSDKNYTKMGARTALTITACYCLPCMMLCLAFGSCTKIHNKEAGKQLVEC